MGAEERFGEGLRTAACCAAAPAFAATLFRGYCEAGMNLLVKATGPVLLRVALGWRTLPGSLSRYLRTAKKGREEG
jgi:hypothetical protein